MWKCHVCNVSFTKESVQHHLFIHHIRPKIGNPQVYNCGDCIFSAEDFEAIAEHCLTLYHEPTKVSKGLDYERYPAELFRSLKTVMRSPYANAAGGGGGDRLSSFAVRRRNTSPGLAAVPPGGGQNGSFQHHNRRAGSNSDDYAGGDRNVDSNGLDWSDISFQADANLSGGGEDGESDDENPFYVFGGGNAGGLNPADMDDPENSTSREKAQKRKADGCSSTDTSSKRSHKKSKNEAADKEQEEPPRPEPVSPLDIGNYIHIWQDLPNPYKITILGTFWKPNDRFPFPYVQYGEGAKNRRCRFSGRWFAQYSWLAYTQREGGGALCAPCVLFNEGPKRGSLVQIPFQKYKNGLERFARHAETLWHRQAIQSMEAAANEFQAAAEEKDVVVDTNQLLEKLREANAEKYNQEPETTEDKKAVPDAVAEDKKDEIVNIESAPPAARSSGSEVQKESDAAAEVPADDDTSENLSSPTISAAPPK